MLLSRADSLSSSLESFRLNKLERERERERIEEYDKPVAVVQKAIMFEASSTGVDGVAVFGKPCMSFIARKIFVLLLLGVSGIEDVLRSKEETGF